MELFTICRWTAAMCLLASLAAAQYGKKSYDGYSVLRIIPKSSAQLEFVRQFYETNAGPLSLDFWSKPHKIGFPVDVMIPPDLADAVRATMAEQGIDAKVMSDDVQKLIDEEDAVNKFQSTRLRDDVGGTRGIGNFRLDTYHNYAKLVDYMKTLERWYSNIVEVIVAPKPSILGVQVVGLKIGRRDGGANRYNRPAVWLDGGIHAREWVAPTVCMYIMEALVDGYRSYNTTIRQYVDEMDFYIFPVLNPDGYDHSRTKQRLWRKNMRKLSVKEEYNACDGVDLNRNFDWDWGRTDSSSNPCDDTYAGDRPFSEPETDNVRALIENIGYRLKGYVAFHSYAQIWAYPYGHQYNYNAPEYEEMKTAANSAASRLERFYGTKYEVGTSADTLYPASGGAADWAKGKRLVTYSYLVELRPSSYDGGLFGENGFFMKPSKLVPTGREIFAGLAAIFDRILDREVLQKRRRQQR